MSLPEQVAAIQDGIVPDGDHLVTLTEVAVVPRKAGGWWGRLLSETSGGRQLREMRRLGADPDDAFMLDQAANRKWVEWGQRMGVNETDARGVFNALHQLQGHRFTARVTKTAHSTTVQHRAFEDVVFATGGQALTTEGEIVTNVAQDQYNRLLEGLNATRLALSVVCQACHELSRDKSWTELGYESLAEFLASPEITLTRTSFFRMAQIWELYVLDGGVDPRQLSVASPSKFAIPMRAIGANEVTAAEAFADVETLGARDLREKYELPKDEESPRGDLIDRLLDDDVIDAAIACFEGTTASGREQWAVTLTEVRDFIKASNA
jgi:hypothetical protein